MAICRILWTWLWVSVATRYGLDGPGIEILWAWSFLYPSRQDLETNHTSYAMSTESFLGVKRPGRGVNHLSIPTFEIKERVELYIYSPPGPSCPVNEWNLPVYEHSYGNDCDTTDYIVVLCVTVVLRITNPNYFYFLWLCSPAPAIASSFTRFLDHTLRRATVGRKPLEEWSARRRDRYLTTHNTHNRKTPMPPVGFEPTIAAGERP
jgi:hypothetical protein